MNIGVIIGRIGDVDGVSLETEKWIKILEKLGHKIFILSGRFKKHLVHRSQETKWAGLSFFSPECEWEQNRAFFFPNEDSYELMDHLEHTSKKIAVKIFKWILDKKIECLLIENASALPCHLSMGFGIKHVIKSIGIPTVTHDHDFAWERGNRYKTPHKSLEIDIKDTFPIIGDNVKHAVINTAAQKTLKKRFNTESTIVPNVMDFNKPYGQLDNYNINLRDCIGLKKSDIPLFQVTRIVKRKGIETAIELVHKLKDKKVKLVITGSAADDERKGYYNELLKKISYLKIKDQIIFGEKRILNDRSTSNDGDKIYSIEDAYANAVACTYFSTYEGFGNSFVECILSKTPIFVNNYKPVFWEDIGKKGFKTVMLEENNLDDKAVQQIAEIIYNKKLQIEIAEHNFNLGKKLFSYEILEEKLTKLFKF